MFFVACGKEFETQEDGKLHEETCRVCQSIFAADKEFWGYEDKL